MTDQSRPVRARGGNFLYERLAEEVARSSRYRLPLCCVVFRVSGPRGSEAGGERLCRAGVLLARRIVRNSDVVGVLGPGCFGVVANASGEGARTLAKSVATELRALDFVHEGTALSVEVRYGIACYHDAKTPREMLEEARAALQLHVPAQEIRGQC